MTVMMPAVSHQARRYVHPEHHLHRDVYRKKREEHMAWKEQHEQGKQRRWQGVASSQDGSGQWQGWQRGASSQDSSWQWKQGYSSQWHGKRWHE